MAQDADDVYLVEMKWTRKPSDIDDVGALFDRLGRTPTTVQGLLVSMNGFTEGAIRDVEARRAVRPVLLIDGQEFEAVVENDSMLRRLLSEKKEALLVHGFARLGSRPETNVERRFDESPTEASARFVTPDGTPVRWITSKGDFGDLALCRELPDVDWVPGGGFGVSLDLSIPVESEEALYHVIGELEALGLSTGSGQWSIAQIATNWYGMGAASLVAALRDWSVRYDSLETVHHTETVCYVDTCDGGLYSLTAEVQATDERRVWRLDLSFQLRGIPVDDASMRHIIKTLGAQEGAYYRPRSSRAVEHCRLTPNRLLLEPLALVVESDATGADPYGDWVVGIAVASPYFTGLRRPRSLPEGVPSSLADVEILVCDLRSHHPLAEAPSGYALTHIEWTWTSEAALVRVRADWPDRHRQAFAQPGRGPKRSSRTSH